MSLRSGPLIISWVHCFDRYLARPSAFSPSAHLGGDELWSRRGERRAPRASSSADVNVSVKSFSHHGTIQRGATSSPSSAGGHTATSGARDSDVHGERVEHGLRATRGDSWVAARAIVIVSSACVSLSLVVRYRYDNVKEANIQGNSKQFKQFKKK